MVPGNGATIAGTRRYATLLCQLPCDTSKNQGKACCRVRLANLTTRTMLEPPLMWQKAQGRRHAHTWTGTPALQCLCQRFARAQGHRSCVAARGERHGAACNLRADAGGGGPRAEHHKHLVCKRGTWRQPLPCCTLQQLQRKERRQLLSEQPLAEPCRGLDGMSRLIMLGVRR